MADGTKTKRSKRPKKAVSGKARKPAAEATEANAAEAVRDPPDKAGANAALAGKAALEGTRAAGKALAVAASKVKVPLAVGGGLAAGAAGGLALVRRRNGQRRGAPDLGPVISAAKRAGSIGEELGRMATLAEKATAAKGK